MDGDSVVLPRLDVQQVLPCVRRRVVTPKVLLGRGSLSGIDGIVHGRKGSGELRGVWILGIPLSEGPEVCYSLVLRSI